MRSLCRPLQVARLAAYGDVKPASALRSTVTMWTCDSIHNSVNCESMANRHSALATSPSLSTPGDSNQSLIESRTGSPNQLYVVVPKPILEDLKHLPQSHPTQIWEALAAPTTTRCPDPRADILSRATFVCGSTFAQGVLEIDVSLKNAVLGRSCTKAAKKALHAKN